MKTLVIVSHPEINNSSTQNFFKASFPNRRDVEWHYIDEIDEFNIKKEQERLLKADRIIFQFPLYWYSIPGKMKLWFDEVLDGDFAFSGTSPLAGKEFGIVTTTGISEKSFKAGGSEGFTMSEILRPMELIAKKLKMKYLTSFIIYQFEYLSDTDKEKLVIDYQRYLTQEKDNMLSKMNWFIEELESKNLMEMSSLLREKYLQLEDLNWQVRMIRESDGEG